MKGMPVGYRPVRVGTAGLLKVENKYNDFCPAKRMPSRCRGPDSCKETVNLSRNGPENGLRARRLNRKCHDTLFGIYASERTAGGCQPRPALGACGGQYALWGGGPQRGAGADGIRPSFRTSDVQGNETRARFRHAGAGGLRREQRLYQQRLHRLLHDAAQGQHRDGPLAGIGPDDGARHHAGEARGGEVGGGRGVQAALPQPALRGAVAAAAGAGL